MAMSVSVTEGCGQGSGVQAIIYINMRACKALVDRSELF